MRSWHARRAIAPKPHPIKAMRPATTANVIALPLNKRRARCAKFATARSSSNLYKHRCDRCQPQAAFGRCRRRFRINNTSIAAPWMRASAFISTATTVIPMTAVSHAPHRMQHVHVVTPPMCGWPPWQA